MDNVEHMRRIVNNYFQRQNHERSVGADSSTAASSASYSGREMNSIDFDDIFAVFATSIDNTQVSTPETLRGANFAHLRNTVGNYIIRSTSARDSNESEQRCSYCQQRSLMDPSNKQSVYVSSISSTSVSQPISTRVAVIHCQAPSSSPSSSRDGASQQYPQKLKRLQRQVRLCLEHRHKFGEVENGLARDYAQVECECNFMMDIC